VVAELRLDHAADLAGLQGEGGLLELAHHAALREEPQVAALGLGAGVVGVLLGELGEVLSRFGLGLEILGLLLGRFLLLRRGVGLDADEDVPRPDHLGVLELLLVRVVIGLEVLLGEVDLADDLLLDVGPGQVLVAHDLDLLLHRGVPVDAFLPGHVGDDDDAGEVPHEDLLHPGIGLDHGLLVFRVKAHVRLDVAPGDFLVADLRKHVLLRLFRRRGGGGGQDEQDHEDCKSACRNFFHLNVSFFGLLRGIAAPAGAATASRYHRALKTEILFSIRGPGFSCMDHAAPGSLEDPGTGIGFLCYDVPATGKRAAGPEGSHEAERRHPDAQVSRDGGGLSLHRGRRAPVGGRSVPCSPGSRPGPRGGHPRLSLQAVSRPGSLLGRADLSSLRPDDRPLFSGLGERPRRVPDPVAGRRPGVQPAKREGKKVRG